jgi:hypothetical protein
MRIRTALAVLAATLLAVTGLAAQPASAASVPGVLAQPGQPTGCYPVFWRFVGRYNQSPSEYGCAVGWEFARDGGMVQDFVNGQMVWSPRQGNDMIVSAWHSTYWTDAGLRHSVNVRWNTSSPFNYDSWLVRTDYNNVYVGQAECRANTWFSLCDRYGGLMGWNAVNPGLYRLVIEGCDGQSTHTCRQSWTNPLWIWF